MYIDVDPDILIEKIYVSRGAKEWFFEFVNSILTTPIVTPSFYQSLYL